MSAAKGGVMDMINTIKFPDFAGLTQTWRVGEFKAYVDLWKTWEHTWMLLRNSGRTSHTTAWMTTVCRKAEQLMPCSSRNVTAQFRVAAGADLRQAVRMVTVMEHPAAAPL